MTSRRIAHLRTKWRRFSALTAILGVRAAVKYCLYRRCGFMFRRRSVHRIHPKQIAYPLSLRLDSSDITVFRGVFIEREYDCLDYIGDVRLVFDCGANVGYSSAYFLSRYPNCKVVAIEPEPGNFALLKRNLAAYGSRAKPIQAAIWSRPASLAMSQEPYRDGREWTRQVRQCGSDETAEVEGVDIETLLAASNHARLTLLKMDIEGAEAVVFAENFRSWLDKTDVITIELHDDSVFGNATGVFFSAIDGQGFDVSRSGELTICKRPDLDKRSA